MIGLHKSQLDTPCLVIDYDMLLANLKKMQQHCQNYGIAYRPHCKTHKCSAIAKLQLEFGAIGLSVAKLSEAEVMISKGLTSILITSPIVSLIKLERLEKLLKTTDQLLLVVDHVDNILQLQSIGKRINKIIPVLLDIDGGVGRTGVDIQDALLFVQLIREQSHLKFIGIQRYAGHIQHISDYTQRYQTSFAVMKEASDLVHELSLQGIYCSVFSGTGTGTYDIDVHVPYLTEIQPGSYVVMDVEYQNIGSMENKKSFNHFLPAMRLLTSVISNHHSSHVTVDAGTKAIYQDVKHFPQVLSHQGLSYEWGGFGDEHGKIVINQSCISLPLATMIELQIPHCDPTINLHDKFYVIQNDKVIDVWDIDGRGKSQ
jgi:D-serine deaminase-like pyridoxal phosphate-dependent protein